MSLLPLAPQQIIAHRGASGYTPENTFAAVRKAYQMGAKWIEFDVMLTGDGVPIIIHDETLTRTTNGRGKVAKATFDQIKQLDAGGWYAPEFAGESVPSFVEWLALLDQLEFQINVELKPSKGQDESTARVALAELQQHWPIAVRPPLISSGSPMCLQLAKQLAPDLPRGAVIHRWHTGWQARLQDHDCVAISVNHRILNLKKMQQLRDMVDYVLAYTVNDLATAQKMFDLGVDAIFSDYPDVMAYAAWH